jgi:hypothetical protein
MEDLTSITGRCNKFSFPHPYPGRLCVPPVKQVKVKKGKANSLQGMERPSRVPGG